jgi:endo-1,4-beta-D-glucanase Y
MNKSTFFCAAIAVAVPACSSSSNDGSNAINPGVGGSPNSSGGASTSALATTGGRSQAALGGSSSVGGSVGTSGHGSATGGATGGAGTGGQGGQMSTKSATGGMSTVNTVTGGTKATGGSTGSVSPGGNTTTQPGTATGGTKASGGTTSTSGIAGSTVAGGGSTSAAGGTKAEGGSAGSPAGGSTVAGCTPPTTYPNLFVTLSGHTQEQSDSKVSAAWSSLFNPSGSGTIYYNGPGSDESYVQDIYNSDVRSEGMSYGMMIAVQLGHQTEFDRIWTWVKNHMAQGCSGDKCTGEIAWSCATSGSKKSNGGAPDGEEYFATALIFAHNRWGDTGKYKYATEAQWVLDLIRTKYFHTDPHIVKFGSNSGVSDPSYVLPAFYQAWACFDTTNATFWNTAVTDGRAFFHNDVDGNGVCPYQASWTGGQTAGANSDSVRCVVNIMMDYNFFKADPWQSQTYAPKFAANEKNAGPPSSYCDALLGFGLPASDGKAFVDKIWSANVPSHDYWNGVLYMLALLHVSGNFKLYY